MAEPVTTQQLSLGLLLVVFPSNFLRITIPNGANNYFRHQIVVVQPSAKSCRRGSLVQYIGATGATIYAINQNIGIGVTGRNSQTT